VLDHVLRRRGAVAAERGTRVLQSQRIKPALLRIELGVEPRHLLLVQHVGPALGDRRQPRIVLGLVALEDAHHVVMGGDGAAAGDAGLGLRRFVHNVDVHGSPRGWDRLRRAGSSGRDACCWRDHFNISIAAKTLLAAAKISLNAL
jgi:hypothetical protein